MNAANRWWVVSIFYLSSGVNYLDRFILAAVSPAIMSEFNLNYEQYGSITAVFGLVYMLSSPLLGWFLDKVGLNLGTSIALVWWSIAGMARGFGSGLTSLMTAHGLMAVGEAAGIPSTAKAAQTYLRQEERAIGSAMSQFGLVIGSTLASLIANYCISRWGWRSAFFVAGWLGFLWIPLWWWASKKAPIQVASAESSGFNVRAILSQRQTWGFICANVLSLGIFLFWTNWTNHYFIKTFKISMQAANNLSPLLNAIPLVGSFLGGWASMRLIRKGWLPLVARRRIYLFGVLGMMLSAFVPMAPSVSWAVVFIGLSSLASSAASVNLYTMPLDAYGGSGAAFGVSLLTAGFGLLNLFANPLIGRVADRHGFAPICVVLAFLPLLAYLILELTKPRAEQTLRT